MLAHGLVDIFATLIQPLWPDLRSKLAVDEGTIQWAFVTWSLATSVSQLLFGYWGDRGRRRWADLGGGRARCALPELHWPRPLAGATQRVPGRRRPGGRGVPPRGRPAGWPASSPLNRSRAMSLFAVGGSIGQAVGPIYGGTLTTLFGLPALAWSMTWGLAILGLLAIGLRRMPEEADLSPSPGSECVPLAWGELMCAGEPPWRSCSYRGAPGAGGPRRTTGPGVPAQARGSDQRRDRPAASVVSGRRRRRQPGLRAVCPPRGERRVLWMLPLFVVPLLCLVPWAGTGVVCWPAWPLRGYSSGRRCRSW